MEVLVSKAVECYVCGTVETIYIPPEKWELPVDNYTCTVCYKEELAEGYDDKSAENDDYYIKKTSQDGSG